jgi:hypothetical protein
MITVQFSETAEKLSQIPSQVSHFLFTAFLLLSLLLFLI